MEPRFAHVRFGDEGSNICLYKGQSADELVKMVAAVFGVPASRVAGFESASGTVFPLRAACSDPSLCDDQPLRLLVEGGGADSQARSQPRRAPGASSEGRVQDLARRKLHELARARLLTQAQARYMQQRVDQRDPAVSRAAQALERHEDTPAFLRAVEGLLPDGLRPSNAAHRSASRTRWAQRPQPNAAADAGAESESEYEAFEDGDGGEEDEGWSEGAPMTRDVERALASFVEGLAVERVVNVAERDILFEMLRHRSPALARSYRDARAANDVSRLRIELVELARTVLSQLEEEEEEEADGQAAAELASWMRGDEDTTSSTSTGAGGEGEEARRSAPRAGGAFVGGRSARLSRGQVAAVHGATTLALDGAVSPGQAAVLMHLAAADARCLRTAYEALQRDEDEKEYLDTLLQLVALPPHVSAELREAHKAVARRDPLPETVHDVSGAVARSQAGRTPSPAAEAAATTSAAADARAQSQAGRRERVAGSLREGVMQRLGEAARRGVRGVRGHMSTALSATENQLEYVSAALEVFEADGDAEELDDSLQQVRAAQRPPIVADVRRPAPLSGEGEGEGEEGEEALPALGPRELVGTLREYNALSADDLRVLEELTDADDPFLTEAAAQYGEDGDVAALVEALRRIARHYRRAREGADLIGGALAEEGGQGTEEEEEGEEEDEEEDGGDVTDVDEQAAAASGMDREGARIVLAVAQSLADGGAITEGQLKAVEGLVRSNNPFVAGAVDAYSSTKDLGDLRETVQVVAQNSTAVARLAAEVPSAPGGVAAGPADEGDEGGAGEYVVVGSEEEGSGGGADEGGAGAAAARSTGLSSQRTGKEQLLGFVTTLTAIGVLGQLEDAQLRGMIAREDELVVAAWEVYLMDSDADELADTLARIARLAAPAGSDQGVSTAATAGSGAREDGSVKDVGEGRGGKEVEEEEEAEEEGLAAALAKLSRRGLLTGEDVALVSHASQDARVKGAWDVFRRVKDEEDFADTLARIACRLREQSRTKPATPQPQAPGAVVGLVEQLEAAGSLTEREGERLRVLARNGEPRVLAAADVFHQTRDESDFADTLRRITVKAPSLALDLVQKQQEQRGEGGGASDSTMRMRLSAVGRTFQAEGDAARAAWLQERITDSDRDASLVEEAVAILPRALMSDSERAVARQLLRERHPVAMAAVDVFDAEVNEDDLVDTLRRAARRAMAQGMEGTSTVAASIAGTRGSSPSTTRSATSGPAAHIRNSIGGSAVPERDEEEEEEEEEGEEEEDGQSAAGGATDGGRPPQSVETQEAGSEGASDGGDVDGEEEYEEARASPHELVQRLAREGLLTEKERAGIVEALQRGHELADAAFKVYEVDPDMDELVDTLKSIAAGFEE